MQIENKIPWAPQSAPTFWINHASRLIMRRFEERLRPYGFGFAYLPVVIAIEESGPMLQKELLRRIAVEQPTMTALLARMERDGVIRRAVDVADGRAQRVSLTRRSKSHLPEIKAAMAEVVEQAMAGVGSEERAALIDSLRRVVQNLSRPSAGDPSSALLGNRNPSD